MWIITTNAFDPQISKYYKDNISSFEGEKATFEEQQSCYETLINKLRKEAIGQSNVSMTTIFKIKRANKEVIRHP